MWNPFVPESLACHGQGLLRVYDTNAEVDDITMSFVAFRTMSDNYWHRVPHGADICKDTKLLMKAEYEVDVKSVFNEEGVSAFHITMM